MSTNLELLISTLGRHDTQELTFTNRRVAFKWELFFGSDEDLSPVFREEYLSLRKEMEKEIDSLFDSWAESPPVAQAQRLVRELEQARAREGEIGSRIADLREQVEKALWDGLDTSDLEREQKELRSELNLIIEKSQTLSGLVGRARLEAVNDYQQLINRKMKELHDAAQREYEQELATLTEAINTLVQPFNRSKLALKMTSGNEGQELASRGLMDAESLLSGQDLHFVADEPEAA